MTIVYVVVNSDRDLWDVRGIFSTRQKAEMASEGDEIEEWELDVIEKPSLYTQVAMWKDGTLHGKPSTHIVEIHDYKPRYWFIKYPIYNFDKTETHYLQGEVVTSDVNEAVKVINQKRIQVLSDNGWGSQSYLDECYEKEKEMKWKHL